MNEPDYAGMEARAAAFALAPQATQWRRALHAMPELGFDLPQTSDYVAAQLTAFGVDALHRGMAQSGVVGLIKGHAPGPTIGLRADMDALPIAEATGLPWASRHPGRMHACGHDGHTAMLLGAAKLLCARRDFAGQVAVIFQPAEEDGGGGEVMVREGLMEAFAITQVYGLHSAPGIPLGHFATRTGGIMAETLEFVVEVTGKGGHAAMPQGAVDPIVIGAQLVGALQTIVARNSDPLEALVVSVTQFHAGRAFNIIPDSARLTGTIRALSAAGIALARSRISALCAGLALQYGAQVTPEFIPSYPVTENHPAETALTIRAAQAVVGMDAVDPQTRPTLGGEDFSYMLAARPGSYMLIGNGASAGLHNPAYDFDDAALPFGIAYWLEVVGQALAPPVAAP